MPTVEPHRPVAIGAETIDAIAASTDRIAGLVRRRLGEELDWYTDLSADDRSWIGVIAQSAIRAFVEWHRGGGAAQGPVSSVFSLAPRDLTRSVSLAQTVEVMRIVVAVVEQQAIELASPAELAELRVAMATFSREVAFSAAQVYAVAAEARGAWDARTESLVVDAVVQGEQDAELLSRATTVGWRDRSSVCVVVGNAPQAPDAAVETMRALLRRADVDALMAVQGRRLVIILGGATQSLAVTGSLAGRFGPGPIVVGPTVSDLGQAAMSARAALAAHRAAPAWPDSPRPAFADDFLAERALAGDLTARAALVASVHRPLVEAGNSSLETVEAYLRTGGGVEATGRELFVHPNTVRYRLLRIEERIGYDLTDAREAYVVQLALSLGRLDHAAASGEATSGGE